MRDVNSYTMSNQNLMSVLNYDKLKRVQQVFSCLRFKTDCS